MAIPNNLQSNFFFHFTHLDNLDSIVKRGLLCTNRKDELGITHFNVAANSIQERRSTMKVTCGPKGVVHDYVPFYLCSTNPMFLSLVNKKNVDQPLVIFFAISIKYVERADVVFTNASANTASPPDFFSDPSDLSQLDWEAIGNPKWARGEDDELHRRMAEVLVQGSVPITDIEYIVVWNENIKEQVEEIFEKNGVECPPIEYTPFKQTYRFHFTKFMFGRGNESLITGPKLLKIRYQNAIQMIIEQHGNLPDNSEFLFENLDDAVEKVKSDFCAIKELEDIFEMETTNSEHSENVSDHTKSVVKNVAESDYYETLSNGDKNILTLSAYLHDIGKGPKSRWEDEKQPRYPDHPADAPKMLVRILSEDIEDISDYEIKMICLLVTYHDLIGEILGKGRDVQQLYDIIENEIEFDMLSCLNLADVSAINGFWAMQYKRRIKGIKDDVMTQLD